MSKILVIFDSETGNTEKMAKAIVEGISQIESVEFELLKAGTPFSITKLNTADALIFGSPTRYGNVTHEMNEFLESAKEHSESNRLKLLGKIGGAFGSYAWDGGWVTYKLEAEMKTLGIQIVVPAVSAVDNMGAMGSRINEAAFKKCREMGKAIANKLQEKDK